MNASTNAVANERADSEAPASLLEGSALEKLAARVVLSLWFPSVLVVCAYLLGGHILTLPSPTGDSVRLTSAVATMRGHGASTADRWIVLHVLYEDCRCSARVLDHLLSRRAEPGETERIVLVSTRWGAEPSEERAEDGALAARIEAAGFELERTSPEALESRYGIQAAPLLVVSDPTGRVRYVGGYTDRKQSVAIRDREILHDLRQGGSVEALPVFGCAVSKTLGESVDPLGLRR